MANFAGTYTSPYSGPTFLYDVSYSETGRGSGWASYSVTVTARMSSSGSYFGYYLDGTVTIGNASQTIRFKENSPTWSGTAGHSFTFNLTPTGCGDGGGLINARLQVSSNSGQSGIIDTGGDETVTCSVWNTAPSLSGSISTNPSGTVPETTSSVTVTWPAASDGQSGVTYTLVRELNQSGSWPTLSTNASSGYVDNIGSGNQGQVIRYAVKATDSGGLDSGWIYSPFITKNTFTPGTLTSSDSIAFATPSIAMTVGAASNTNGVTTGMTYTLSCSNSITVYNPTLAAGANTIKIWRTGDATTGCYIKFDDIKTAFASGGTSYKGTLTFTLTSTNTYGSSGTVTKTISVDLTSGVSLTFAAPTIDTTSYYTIPVAGNIYIPNRKAIKVNWVAPTDPLGSPVAIKYDVQVSLGGGAYTTVASDVSGATTSFNLSAVSSATSCVVKVIPKTSYGVTTSNTATSITLHYYNPPTIVYDPVVRNQTTAVISGKVKLNTSIPSITISTTNPSSYYTTSGGLVTALTVLGSINTSTGVFSTTVTIASDKTCSFNLTEQDSAGAVIGTAASTLSVSVGAYIPAVAIRPSGIGINAMPDGTNRVVIGGDVMITEGLNPAFTLQQTTDTEGGGGLLRFVNPAKDQGVQIRYNHFDATRAPFGLHIERSTTDNAQPTSKAYLQVEGDIVSGATIYSTAGISAGGTLAVTGTSTFTGAITANGGINFGSTSYLKNSYANQRIYYDVVEYNNSSSSVTGCIKITMPKTWSSTMMQIVISGYDYAGGRGYWKVTLSGYNYSNGASSAWTQYTCNPEGNPPFDIIRFAHDGTKNCILLGSTSTVWYYPKATVERFVAAHSNVDGWETGWSTSLITVETGITNAVTMAPDKMTFGALSNAGIELGRTDGVASTPYIDFHCGSTMVDYDVRLIASGGNGNNGCAGLNAYAEYFTCNSFNGGYFNFDRYCQWSQYGGSVIDVTGGGAGIINDSSGYQCLMILGNRSGSSGYRQTKVWDDLETSHNLRVGYAITFNGNPTVITSNGPGNGLDIYNGASYNFQPASYRGTWFIMDGNGSGTGGTEASLRPSTNNMNFVGTPSYKMYQFWSYSTLQTSTREDKVEVYSMDTNYAYDTLKNMKTYKYRHVDRDDLMLGVMLDEAPIEVIDHFSQAGINLYSWTTLTTCALQEAMKKIETLENEVRMLGGNI